MFLILLLVSKNLHTEKEKIENLCNHSERIALAYALVYLPEGGDIYLWKNLRVCKNCHEATRLNMIRKMKQTWNQEASKKPFKFLAKLIELIQ